MGFVMVQAAQKLQDQGCLCECHGQGASAATQAELLGETHPSPLLASSELLSHSSSTGVSVTLLYLCENKGKC